MKRLFLLLPAVCLLSCNGNIAEVKKLNQKIDSLCLELKIKGELLSMTENELNEYKADPSDILAVMKTTSNYDMLKAQFQRLERYHPFSKQIDSAKIILNNAAVEHDLKAKQKIEREKTAERDRIASMSPIERLKYRMHCTDEQAKEILNHSVSVGMTAEMCREAWGRPRKINRTAGAYGVHEQWCYDGGYLYFEDGILTTIQN